jgi:hypothetical protein
VESVAWRLNQKRASRRIEVYLTGWRDETVVDPTNRDLPVG